MHLLFFWPSFFCHFCSCAPPLTPPKLLKKILNELVEETWHWMEFSSLRGWSLFWKRSEQRNSTTLYHPSKPPSVPSSATVVFPIEWVLVRDANVFMGDVALEYCWAKPPFIQSREAHTCLERGLQLQFKNTENDGIAVWPEQLKPLLMSGTHGASGP